MKTLIPTREQIKELLSNSDDKPLVMINLLKFKSRENGKEEGQLAYNNYAAAVEPMLKKIGGRVLWMGSVEQVFIGLPDDHWDRVLLVEYPSREAFIGMVSTPEYLEVHKDRESGLANSVLLASTTTLSVMKG